MKILVPVKRVIDPYAKVRVKSDHTGVDTQNIKMSINPFDEIALEEAIQLKEQGHCDEIIAVSIGPEQCQETLRTALALGADQAFLVQHDEELEPLIIAKVLQNYVTEHDINLVIMGKQSIDGDNNQTGQMLAALLSWSQATFASNVEMKGEKIDVTREIDGGLETLSLDLPAVITTDLRLNVPRYASLPSIMKAKKKPLEITTLEALGISSERKIHVDKVEPPAVRSGGVMLENVQQLVEKLKTEAKVI